MKSEHYFKGHKTIFTDLMAVLKHSAEVVDKLNKNSKLFEDPDFGPHDDDEYGDHSMYLDGVTPGAVLPEDVVWLRPS